MRALASRLTDLQLRVQKLFSAFAVGVAVAILRPIVIAAGAADETPITIRVFGSGTAPALIVTSANGLSTIFTIGHSGEIVRQGDIQLESILGALTFTKGLDVVFSADSPPSNDETALAIAVGGDGLQQVRVGDLDSGGTGYRVLVVPN